MSETFDYLVVGGGTAACILAYRLGEAGHSVCVVEAGPRDRHLYLKIPAGFSKTLLDPSVTWQFKSQPDPAIGGRQIGYTQGRTLGGSGSVNGMIYNRGQAADFDGWAQAGNPGWGYDDLLPVFRKIEDFDAPGSDPKFRGRGGRLKVVKPMWPNPLEDSFLKAAEALGYAESPDYNGEKQEGWGRYQSSMRRGWRESTATAYLRPAERKFRVKVMTDTLVTRVLLDGSRATGVEIRQGGEVRRLTARAEVIVSAGAINSPKLLQLSGIGPGDLLSGCGVEVLHDLPAVGENLRDHFSPRVVARARRGVRSLNGHVTGLPLAWQVLRWMAGRDSVLSVSPARVFLFAKSDPVLDNPDLTLIFMPASFKAGLVGVLDDFPGMTCGVWPMRPRSSGYVRITAADPGADPDINPRYLTDPEDVRLTVAALKLARRIFATEPLAGLVEQETFPGPQADSDADLEDFARRGGATSFHLCGSCRMGPKDRSDTVVGPDLRVHGMDGLRVIDSSVIPMIPSANTAASTMVIGEKGAEAILSGH